MGFGYKTSWIAVRDRTASQVAEALGLTRFRTMAFREGTELGYAAGLYVAPPYEGWTLAHGRALTAGIDPTSPAFVDWLARLSRTLGEVQ